MRDCCSMAHGKSNDSQAFANHHPPDARQPGTDAMPPHTLKSTIPALACLHLPMMMIVDLEDLKKTVELIFLYLLIRPIVFYVAGMLLSGIIEYLHS